MNLSCVYTVWVARPHQSSSQKSHLHVYMCIHAAVLLSGIKFIKNTLLRIIGAVQFEWCVYV